MRNAQPIPGAVTADGRTLATGDVIYSRRDPSDVRRAIRARALDGGIPGVMTAWRDPLTVYHMLNASHILTLKELRAVWVHSHRIYLPDVYPWSPAQWMLKESL